jgi:hypothetical protein
VTAFEKFIRDRLVASRQCPRFLAERVSAESSARRLLESFVGRFRESDAGRFFDWCNTELRITGYDPLSVPPEPTLTRFRLSFVGRNRNLMLRDLRLLNHWLEALWRDGHRDPHGGLERFWSSGKVPGAGTGLPTMILYLRDPNRHVIWLPTLSQAVAHLSGRRAAPRRTWQEYVEYLNAVDELIRKPFGAEPQEVDYLLSCVAERLGK